MAKRTHRPHLEAQPAQSGASLGGVEVEDVDAGRAGEDLLDRVQLPLDLDGMLANHPEVAITHRADHVRPAQPQSLPAHHQIDSLDLRQPASLADRQYTNHNNNDNPTTLPCNPRSNELELSRPQFTAAGSASEVLIPRASVTVSSNSAWAPTMLDSAPDSVLTLRPSAPSPTPPALRSSTAR